LYARMKRRLLLVSAPSLYIVQTLRFIWPTRSNKIDLTYSTNTRTRSLEIRCSFYKPKTLQIKKNLLEEMIHL